MIRLQSHLPGSFSKQPLQAAIQPAKKRPEKQLYLSHELIGRMLGLKPLQRCLLYMPI